MPSIELALALWLESDRMGYLLEKLDQSALDNQKDVVRNERRQSVENPPYGMSTRPCTRRSIPQGHPYYAT